MHHELAGLCGGAGDAGTQHEGIEAGLQIGEHCVAGLACGVGALFIGGAELLLRDAILSAQTLLLAQADRVIGLGAAAGTAMLTRSIRTFFEDALCLRGQRDAEGAGKTHLKAGTIRHDVSFVVLSLSESGNHMASD